MMNPPNKARWIFVALTATATFFFGGAVLEGISPAGSGSEWVVVVAALSAIVTGFILAAPLQVFSGKRFAYFFAMLLVLTCLIPPWQYTIDRPGYHSRAPAGYMLLLSPPSNPDRSIGSGVQIDFGRLFLGWLALAAVGGVVWIPVVRSTPRDDKADRPGKIISPPDNTKN